MYHQNHGSAVRYLFFVLAICSIIFGASSIGTAANVYLAWDPVSGVAGYKVYYGLSSGNYIQSGDVGNKTTATIPNLSDGTRYYITVTAYDSSRTESSYSNEVIYGSSDSCTYTVSPTSASYGSTGGTGTISVSAAAGCAWSASTGVSWIKISSGATGSGNGSVTYSVAANTGASRSASFTVAGRSFTVSQAGATSGGAYTLTVTKAGTGSGTVTTNPAGPTYAYGTRVTLTATPDANSEFVGFSGDCNSTGLTCSGTITRNVNVTATFKAKTTTGSYSITASAGTGGSISPSGSVSVAYGSSRSFIITPNSGYQVSDVAVDGRSVGALSSYTFTNVTANHTIRAAFRSSSGGTTYSLTVTRTGTGSGTVTASPEGPTYAYGTRVTLTATPDANSVFVGYSGDCNSTGLTCSGTMTRNVYVTATFRAR